jgi:hypothetical protein
MAVYTPEMLKGNTSVSSSVSQYLDFSLVFVARIKERHTYHAIIPSLHIRSYL